MMSMGGGSADPGRQGWGRRQGPCKAVGQHAVKGIQAAACNKAVGDSWLWEKAVRDTGEPSGGAGGVAGKRT